MHAEDFEGNCGDACTGCMRRLPAIYSYVTVTYIYMQFIPQQKYISCFPTCCSKLSLQVKNNGRVSPRFVCLPAPVSRVDVVSDRSTSDLILPSVLKLCLASKSMQGTPPGWSYLHVPYVSCPEFHACVEGFLSVRGVKTIPTKYPAPTHCLGKCSRRRVTDSSD